MNLFNNVSSTSTQDVYKIVNGYVFLKEKSSETKHYGDETVTKFKTLKFIKKNK